jgi:hypothetical protein
MEKLKMSICALIVATFLLNFAATMPLAYAKSNQPVAIETEVSGELLDSMAATEVKSFSGNVKITSFGTGFADIRLSSGSGYIIKNTAIPIRWEVLRLPDGRVVLNDINIDDYKNGLFISISILSNGDGWLHLATCIGARQYDLAGYLNNPLSLKPLEQKIAAVSKMKGEEVELAPGIIKKPLPIRTESETVYVFAVGEDRPVTKTTIFTNVNKIGPLKIIKPTFYGLVHEVFFDADNAVPEQVPAWMRDGTWIDYGVYVEAPSEARIKSDYQRYNRYYYYDELASKELWAYEIDTHGMSIDEPDKPLLGADSSWLYPNEVTALWYYGSDLEIAPHGTILLMDACVSLWDADESSGSEMGNAWINFGADAYVGSTINVPIVMDAFTREFWQSLCYQEETVGKAEADASTARGLGATAFLVLGNPNRTLP